MNKFRVKRKRPVTIIIGLIYKGGIIVGSDGQTSYWPHTAKEPDTNKITVVPLNGAKALIAQAGNADLSTRTIELILEKATGASLAHKRTLADIAEEAMVKVKAQLRDYHAECTTAEDYQRLFEDYDFSLMVANYFNGEPNIFSVSFSHGMAIKQTKNYVTLGCGSNLAQFLLCDLNIAEMEFLGAISTAYYVIEKVKKHDAACGGDTRLAELRPDGGISKTAPNDDLMKALVAAYANIEAAANKDWNAKMAALAKQTSDYMEDHPEEP